VHASVSRLTVVLAAAVCAGAAPAAAEFPDTRADLGMLSAAIAPTPDEANWERVAWLTSVDEARRRSAAEDKPLLVWRAGGGDVLGRA
jgi:hypothetical protein